MALTLREKQAVTKELAWRHVRARQERQTGDCRPGGQSGQLQPVLRHLLLRTYARQVRLPQAHGPALICETAGKELRPVCARPRVCDERGLAALRRVWLIADCICGKRLAPSLAKLAPILETIRDASHSDASDSGSGWSVFD